jgi:hypothetical protein
MYFMDLRAAPTMLRIMFEIYCAVVFTALAAMFLLT